MTETRLARVICVNPDQLEATLDLGYQWAEALPSRLEMRERPGLPGSRVEVRPDLDAARQPLPDGLSEWPLQSGAQLLFRGTSNATALLYPADVPSLRVLELAFRNGQAEIKLAHQTGIPDHLPYTLGLDVRFEGFEPIDEARFRLGDDGAWQELETGQTILEAEGGITFSIVMGACRGLRLRLVWMD